MADQIAAVFKTYGHAGLYEVLTATGVANRIYATHDVVLRIATDHPEAITDALTESVAAPVARAAGVRTPKLLAFDDSRTLVNRPFSLWERVHGETLGSASLDSSQRAFVWSQVGEELRRLHDSVKLCPDPRGYLDRPGYELALEATLRRAIDSGAVSLANTRAIEQLLNALAPHVATATYQRCFVHNDVHEMNVMCTASGRLLALIDWGDAGWGDPTLDFAEIPLDCVESALRGYGNCARDRFGRFAGARLVWTKLRNALDDAALDPQQPIPLAQYLEFLDRDLL